MSESSASSNSCPKCGAALPSAATAGLCPRCLLAEAMVATQADAEQAEAQKAMPPEELAPHFPQLEILECLGRGGMGVVYKARQKTLNRFVALKLLAPERVGDGKFAERFTREAQALAALNHPNIVTIHDFGQAGGFYFLLMEFVDGVNLRQLLRARKFTPEEALAIVPPLCDALQYAHDRGIVHRDIKPENLLLDKDGRVKVADFGIAKMIEPEAGKADLPVSREIGAAQQHGPTSDVGTPGYSAPEQKTDPQRVDSRADIYSLGVVFYEMLTGELPGKRLEPPSRKVQIDVRLDEVVLRALDRNPDLRYQQVSEVKTMVETIVGSAPEANPAAKHQPSARAIPTLRPRFSRMAIAAPLLIALGVAIGIAGLFLVIFVSHRINSRIGNGLPLGMSPQGLESAPTAAVFQAGLSQPTVPWAWMELEKRAKAGRISAEEANRFVNDLAAWMRRDYPHGYDQPLGSIGDWLGVLDGRHLLAVTNVLAFLDAFCGSPSIEPLARVRENTRSLMLTCKWRNPWFNGLFGCEFLNQMRSITIDGQLLPARDFAHQNWNQWQCDAQLELLNLAPGKHIVRCEVESALVAAPDMAGLAATAPFADWPPAKRRWTRVCQAEFVVYANDAEIVRLTEDPALDPVATGALSIRQVIIRLKGASRTAALAFNMGDRVPISVDVTLRLAGEDIPCGKLFCAPLPHGSSRGPTELTANIGALDPQVTEADILLTPNPKAAESNPGIERIWGKEIVFRHVPLSRQDLVMAKPLETNTPMTTNRAYPPMSFGPVMERVLPDFAAISLASGQVAAMPKSVLEQNRVAGNKDATDDWMKSQGMDIANFGDEGLECLEMAMPTLKLEDWENYTADLVTDRLYSRYTFAHGILGARFLNSAPDHTFVFKTRKVRLGILQITGFTDTPRRVKLRYKLVQNGRGEK